MLKPPEASDPNIAHDWFLQAAFLESRVEKLRGVLAEMIAMSEVDRMINNAYAAIVEDNKAKKRDEATAAMLSKNP